MLSKFHPGLGETSRKGKGKRTMHVSQCENKAWTLNGDERRVEWHRDSVACHCVTTLRTRVSLSIDIYYRMCVMIESGLQYVQHVGCPPEVRNKGYIFSTLCVHIF